MYLQHTSTAKTCQQIPGDLFSFTISKVCAAVAQMEQHQIRQLVLIPAAYKSSTLISGCGSVGMPPINFLQHPRSFEKSVPGLIQLCKVTHSSRTAKA